MIDPPTHLNQRVFIFILTSRCTNRIIHLRSIDRQKNDASLIRVTQNQNKLQMRCIFSQFNCITIKIIDKLREK